MTKSTTERLEKLQDDLLQFQDSYSDPADKENYDIFVDVLHVIDEFKAAKEKLLAYEQAEPVGEFYHEKQGGWYQISEGDKVSDSRRIPLYAAPVLPKHPEPVAWTDSDELKDAKNRGSAYLFSLDGEANKFADPRRKIMLYTAPPAQPVIPEQPELRYGDNVLWFLNELAAFDASDIDSDDFDVYGEDLNGMEGCATISITELAADAAKLLSAQSAIQLAPHVYRDLVNNLRDTAVMYSGSGQLREQLNRTLSSVITAAHSHLAQPVSEPYKLNGWISVDEKMPEDGDAVLVHQQGGIIFCAEVEDGWFYPDEFPNVKKQGRDITHWMPLPAAPAQESK